MRVHALLLGAACSFLSQAQWLHHRDPHTPRTGSGRPNLTAPAPRDSGGNPDLSGVWMAERTPPDEILRRLGPKFADLQIDQTITSKYTVNLLWDLAPAEPLTPRATATLLLHQFNHFNDAPSVRCLPMGIPYSMLILPFKAIQTRNEVVLLF